MLMRVQSPIGTISHIIEEAVIRDSFSRTALACFVVQLIFSNNLLWSGQAPILSKAV